MLDAKYEKKIYTAITEFIKQSARKDRDDLWVDVLKLSI
jgi:hypothetical protein